MWIIYLNDWLIRKWIRINLRRKLIKIIGRKDLIVRWFKTSRNGTRAPQSKLDIHQFIKFYGLGFPYSIKIHKSCLLHE
jgi:hypothetical protein